jgi:hypothetical protein
MATITRLGFLRHLRSEPNVHVVRCRAGKSVQSGRGLSFWFLPLTTTAIEVTCDDLEQAFLFHARSADFQDVTAQGTVTYRVSDPERLGKRVDFSLDLRHGTHQKKPLEHLAAAFTQRAQELAWSYLGHTAVREILAQGVEAVRERIATGLAADEGLRAMGLEVVSVRVSRHRPDRRAGEGVAGARARAHPAIRGRGHLPAPRARGRQGARDLRRTSSPTRSSSRSARGAVHRPEGPERAPPHRRRKPRRRMSTESRSPTRASR